MNGWVCVDVGPLQRFASVVIRVGNRSGSPGEHLAAPEGPVRVLVMAQAVNATGVLRVDATVVEGRVTTLFCLPLGAWSVAAPRYWPDSSANSLTFAGRRFTSSA
jgi:hypothetical protein